VLIVSQEDAEELFLLDARSGAHRHTIRTSRGRGIDRRVVAFCPHGRLLALPHRGRDGRDTIAVYEVCTGQVRLELCPGNEVTALTFSPDGRRLATGHGSGTALLWDLDVAVPRSPASGYRLWRDLSGDARAAYRALLALERQPVKAIRLARKHVRPAAGKALSAAEVDRLIGQLDADDFADRERATATLKERIEEVEPALLKALKNGVPLEARLRLKRLIDLRPALYPRELVVPLRVVELLERIGTLEARQVLAELAGGYCASLLTAQAKATLARWGKR
jgi:hypothetical protein